MMRYLTFSRIAIAELLVYRAHTLLTALGSGVYIFLIYHLWQAIYENTDTTIHNLSLEQAILRISLALIIFSTIKTWADTKIAVEVTSGKLMTTMSRPVDYQLFRLSDAFGSFVFQLIFVAIPLLTVLYFFNIELPSITGRNSVFILALIFSFILAFNIDYIIGLLCFYTESIWGVMVGKDAVMLFLSGALVPISFFPTKMQEILTYTPFPSLFQTPISLFTNQVTDVNEILSLLANQFFWIFITFILGRLFFNHSIKKIRINGG